MTKAMLTQFVKKIILRINNRKLKRIFTKFTSKVGLVYFGFVDQHHDEHKVIRGLTVSSTHIDDHYSVGSVGGYNISIVNRSDSVWYSNKISHFNNWLIMSFDLHSKIPIPHLFIGAKNRDLRPFAALFSTFPNMKELEFDNNKYGQEFTNRFNIYGRPGKSFEIQQVITENMSKIIGAHLWPFSAEQHNNVLYLYSSGDKVTISLLESMIENGIWLSSQLDKNAESIRAEVL